MDVLVSVLAAFS